MTTLNWIELAVIVVVFTVLIVLRIVTKRRLDAIDGMGTVRKKRANGGKKVIDL